MPIKTQLDEQSSINLTPLIDVVFLLIIFFMVGTRFSELNDAERAIPLQVPQVSDGMALSAAPRKRIINVLQDGRVFLDEKPTTIKSLREHLSNARKQYKQLGVVVRGDANSQYQRVVDVIAACRQAEINDLNISVRVADAPQSETESR
jgi:biopolymer transport protein ExbD